MQSSNDKTRIGFYIEKDVLKQCDDMLAVSNSRSRNEFVNNALRFYIAYHRTQEYMNILSNSLSSAISATIQDSENRMSRALFKLAVEVDMMMNVIASMGEIDKTTLDRLRGKCVDDVKKSTGSLKFEDAMKYQHNKER